MSETSLAALIINWNGAHDTLELIESLVQCVGPDLSISCFVVDNHSSDVDRLALEVGIRKLCKVIPIRLLRNSENVGVPAAYNQAIQAAGPDQNFYLRLDNDVVVDADGLRTMIAVARREPETGIVGGNIKFYAARETNNGGAVQINLVQGRTHVTYPEADEICDGVLGCIMLMPGSLIRRYAPCVFLDKLFICTDESELSLRAATDGLKTRYIHRCVGFHKGAASTGKVPFLSQYYSARNWTYLRFRYTRRWTGKLGIALEIIYRLVVNTLRWRKAYLRGVMAGAGMLITERCDRKTLSRLIG